MQAVRTYPPECAAAWRLCSAASTSRHAHASCLYPLPLSVLLTGDYVLQLAHHDMLMQAVCTNLPVGHASTLPHPPIPHPASSVSHARPPAVLYIGVVVQCSTLSDACRLAYA